MAESILSLSHVNFGYGMHHVLDDVSLIMNSDDFLAIIGPNGGGKSTLIRLIMGLLTPHSGEILLFGQPVSQGRLRVGYLPQLHSIDLEYPLTAEEVVVMSRLQGRWWKRITALDKKDARNALDQVGMAALSKRPLSSLSGGEKQRVFIARALLNQPDLLILDEPTTSVDSQAEESLYTLLKQLHRSMAILMISHDLSAVSRLVNKIACLNRKLVFHGDRSLHQHDLETIYGCPVALIAHDTPHHLLHAHD